LEDRDNFPVEAKNPLPMQYCRETFGIIKGRNLQTMAFQENFDAVQDRQFRIAPVHKIFGQTRRNVCPQPKLDSQAFSSGVDLCRRGKGFRAPEKD
jgi:hypothetical protein